MLRYQLGVSVILLSLGSSSGCTGRFRNTPLEQYDPSAGYRFDSLVPGDGNTDDVFVVVGLSGGGTRAAAFAYAVLKGLGEVSFGPGTVSEENRRMLDEVDVISLVSGGSYTAMGYGLWGDQLFDGRFKERFLTHNIQLDLLLHDLSPFNLLRMPLPWHDVRYQVLSLIPYVIILIRIKRTRDNVPPSNHSRRKRRHACQSPQPGPAPARETRRVSDSAVAGRR